jgi:hypothetical protein
MKLVNIFHIIFVGGIFLYFGITQTNNPKIALQILMYLGIFIIIYHIYKAYIYKIEGKNYWVNLIHILIIGPLLVYIGYNVDKTHRLYFELLMMLGFASVGYHTYYLLI